MQKLNKAKSQIYLLARCQYLPKLSKNKTHSQYRKYVKIQLKVMSFIIILNQLLLKLMIDFHIQVRSFQSNNSSKAVMTLSFNYKYNCNLIHLYIYNQLMHQDNTILISYMNQQQLQQQYHQQEHRNGSQVFISNNFRSSLLWESMQIQNTTE